MSDLYIDLSKGGHELDKGKLVKRAVQVHGENGKMFTRMQWVDPGTGQPVFHRRIHHTMDELLEMENQEQDNIRAGGEPTKMPPYIAHNIKPFPAKLGLRHTKHGLPDAEVEKRHGQIGSLDLSKLTEGTPLTDDSTPGIAFSKVSLEGRRFTRDYHDQVDVKAHISNIFKGVTKEGLEHVFSDPNGKYYAKLLQLSVSGDEGTGYIGCNFDMEWRDAKTNRAMGGCARSIFRDKNGHLHVYTDLMQIDHKYQDKGVGANDQLRTEQFWRHLSDGHPVHLSLEANISVGVYAWATKGYDFENEDDLQLAREEFGWFCTHNGLDKDETLHKCGYNSVDDLQHSWQFAYLNDGNFYNLQQLAMNVLDDDDIKSKSTGHLGKCFMIGGKKYWNGEKILNGGTDHESVAEAHHSIKPPKKTVSKKKQEVKP